MTKSEDFLHSKGIDPAQIVSYHYSEDKRGDTPSNGIDIDIETLLKEYGDIRYQEGVDKQNKSLNKDK